MKIEQKKRKNISIKRKEKGFVILIAIVVSSLLVSLGMFIANIAHKELILSISAKASQRAFFIADSVVECALRFDFRDSGFVINEQDYTNRGSDVDSSQVKMKCNNYLFSPDIIDTEPAATAVAGSVPDHFGRATSIYYISYAEDTDSDSVISDAEARTQNAPYAKLEVIKEDIGGADDKTILRAYGHNKYLGTGLVERAIEVTY